MKNIAPEQLALLSQLEEFRKRHESKSEPSDWAPLSDRGKEPFAELLDAKVSAVRPGPYGTELVLDGVDPQLLVQYDQAIADCARAESAMKLFM